VADKQRAARELLKLLPSGVAGLSMSLAAADASAIAVAEKADRSVGDRMASIRSDVAGALEQHATDAQPFVAIDRDLLLAWWGNGWHNGGWHNGGWGNGGAAWHNGGWANGGAAWHNGGWANGGAAWHNGGFRNW
jgi:rSAM-associated Gly-rich repeat protein